MNGEKNIRLLIGKFMQGLTSIEEEERISQWFAVHADVSDDLKPYQQMFAYFDKGMPMDGPMPEDGKRLMGMFAVSRFAIVRVCARCGACLQLPPPWLCSWL